MFIRQAKIHTMWNVFEVDIVIGKDQPSDEGSVVFDILLPNSHVTDSILRHVLTTDKMTLSFEGMQSVIHGSPTRIRGGHKRSYGLASFKADKNWFADAMAEYLRHGTPIDMRRDAGFGIDFTERRETTFGDARTEILHNMRDALIKVRAEVDAIINTIGK